MWVYVRGGGHHGQNWEKTWNTAVMVTVNRKNIQLLPDKKHYLGWNLDQ